MIGFILFLGFWPAMALLVKIFGDIGFLIATAIVILGLIGASDSGTHQGRPDDSQL